jgi:hypothetical protein
MTMLSIFDEPETVEQLRETFVRYYVGGEPHGKPAERRTWGIYDTLDDAMARYKQVLAEEYAEGGVVTVSEVHIYCDTYEGASSTILHGGRR